MKDISKLNFKLFCFFKLERLQRENAEEYGKRERLETDTVLKKLLTILKY
jgi:hypothetical protein